MALVEFSVTVQTGDHVDDPLTRDDVIKLNTILDDMKTAANKSDYGYEIAEWEVLSDE